MAEPITAAEALGILVVHELNQLYTEPCCADCCAPCDALRRLAARPKYGDEDDLEDIICRAPDELAAPWINRGGVDREWLASRWDCQGHPRCERTGG